MVEWHPGRDEPIYVNVCQSRIEESHSNGWTNILVGVMARIHSSKNNPHIKKKQVDEKANPTKMRI